MHEDAMTLVPLKRVEPEPVWFRKAAEHAGQEDPVVGAVRLSAEHADRKALRLAGQHFLDHFGPCHAGSGDDQNRTSTLAHCGTLLPICVKRWWGRRQADLLHT